METLHLRPMRTYPQSKFSCNKTRSTRACNNVRTRTAIIDQGNPGDWHGTLANATATTVGCANDAEVFFFHGLLRRDGLLRACTRATDDVGGCPWMCVTPLSTIRQAPADLTAYVTDG